MVFFQWLLPNRSAPVNFELGPTSGHLLGQNLDITKGNLIVGTNEGAGERGTIGFCRLSHLNYLSVPWLGIFPNYFGGDSRW